MYAKQIDIMPIDEAYEHFAVSIVIQAIDDYRKVLHKVKVSRYRNAQHSKNEIERFFRSEWCHQLCGWDGDEIMETIKEQEGIQND